MVGPTSAELESLNELIKFDHVYYKNQPLTDTTGSSVLQAADVQCEKVSGQVNITISCDTPVKSEKEENVSDLDMQINAETIVKEMQNILPDINMDLLKDIENYIENEMDIEPVGQSCLDTVDNTPQGGVSLLEKAIKSDSLQSISTNKDSRKRRLSDICGIVSDIESSSSIADDQCVMLGNDSGISSDYSDAGSPYSENSEKIGDVPSPYSDISGGLSEDHWEESFIELFPDLV